jgi:hypothetical protein
VNVDVEASLGVLLLEEVVELENVLVFPGVGRAENSDE